MDELDIGARLIARMSGSTASMGESLRVTHAGITRAELGALLARLDNLGGLLARRVYGLEYHVMPELERAAYVYTAQLAAVEGWRMPRGKELLRKMTALALKEIIDPDKCPSCKGTAQEWDKDRARGKDCSVCGGTGRGRLTSALRAEMVDICSSTWSSRWAGRYERVVSVMQATMEHVARCVARAYLGDDGKDRKPGLEQRPFMRARRPKMPGRVYFMQCGDRIKVGVASNPEQRRKELQTGNPEPITILVTVACEKAYKLEKAIHRKLKRHSVGGEWFANHGDVERLIDAAKEGEEELWFYAAYPG